MTSSIKGVQRCGFTALLGAPNAGKSTLMNTMVGSKVSIVTPKIQTTRTRILGVTAHKATQIVFVDTPGIFDPKRRLDRAMVAAAWGGGLGCGYGCPSSGCKIRHRSEYTGDY